MKSKSGIFYFSLSTPVASGESVLSSRKISNAVIKSKEFKKGHQALRLTSFLPGQQSQLFLMFLEAVHRSDFTEFKHVFSGAQVGELFGIERRYVGSRLKDVVESLSEVKVDIAPFVNKTESDYMFRSLFDKADYVDGDFIFEVHSDVIPIVTDALKSFALVDREVFLLQRSDYGVNLYQYLSRFKNSDKPWFSRPVEELMFVFGVKDSKGKVRDRKGSYAIPSKFVRYVLCRAIEDLDKSDAIKKIKFKEHKCKYTEKTMLGIELVRRGDKPKGRIESVIFHYEWVLDEQKPRLESPEDVISRLKKKGLALKSKGKKLGLEDLKEMRQAYSDINDKEKMELLDRRIEELSKEDSELEELRSLL
ncbi:replication initiation protein [Aliidiomarina quisquiliarum]|uniref:replication initiation protein n=1 Tax=Aliidiomarina quisquiliarum TaxID=2938947 RepID=UPI00208E8394|nr:replication initiation protein [Aliidiomarina quisquiliarum]MCO4319898.1 replication initiation protein [Aliidiomarina quisquiliarum]